VPHFGVLSGYVQNVNMEYANRPQFALPAIFLPSNISQVREKKRCPLKRVNSNILPYILLLACSISHFFAPVGLQLGLSYQFR